MFTFLSQIVVRFMFPSSNGLSFIVNSNSIDSGFFCRLSSSLYFAKQLSASFGQGVYKMVTKIYRNLIALSLSFICCLLLLCCNVQAHLNVYLNPQEVMRLLGKFIDLSGSARCLSVYLAQIWWSKDIFLLKLSDWLWLYFVQLYFIIYCEMPNIN